LRSRNRGATVVTAAAAAAVVAASLAALLVGCTPPPPPGSVSSAPSSAPSAVAPSVSPPTSSAPSPPVGAAVADPHLFELLPDTSDRFSLTYDPATTATVAADPGLDPAVDALATGLYRLRDAPADSPDFAIVNVVHLRSPNLDDEWFRSWRETYDEGACGQAGGVVRRAETPIRDLIVYVGSCAGDAFTYHVRLNEGSVVLSMTSIGPARIGQAVTERLGQ
jgi:hypothetical protein